MQETKLRVPPLLIIGVVGFLAILGIATPGGIGESRQQSPNVGGNKDYFPKEGERAYNINLGAEARPNLAILVLAIDGVAESFDLKPNGGGIYVRAFEATRGTTIVMKVHRTGKIGSQQRSGEIGCYIKENGRVVSGGTMENNPLLDTAHCAWVVGQQG